MDASSENVSPKNYQKIKDFIKKTSKYLSIGGGEDRVAIILYGTEVSVVITFDQHYSEFDLYELIDNLPPMNGKARIDKALRVASSTLFTVEGGSRPGIQKVCVVLTCGKQTAADDAETLKVSAEVLHQANIRVIGIGVGSMVDWANLRSITVDNNDIIISSSFDNLFAKVNHLLKRLCLNPGKNSRLFKQYVSSLNQSITK